MDFTTAGLNLKIIQVPAALVWKDLVSASSVAWIMYQKYANGILPLPAEERLETVWIQMGRTTLVNWIVYCSQNYFQTIYD